MILEIFTPEKKVYSGEADAVQMPGTEGSFQVLKDHDALIASLKEGQMKVENGSDVQLFNIKSGFVEVLQDKITVLVEGVVAE